MFGMVLVSHGAIGAELLKTLDQIVGPQSQIEAVNIEGDDDMDMCRDRILAAVQNVDAGDGAVLLTDMFGGTPSNLALSVMPNTRTVVLAGVSLPVLIKLASLREKTPLLEAAEEAAAAGRKYIQLVTENLAAPTE